METRRLKTRHRLMRMCRGIGKSKMSDLGKEKKKELSEIHRTATKVALEKQKAKEKK